MLKSLDDEVVLLQEKLLSSSEKEWNKIDQLTTDVNVLSALAVAQSQATSALLGIEVG